MLTLNWLINAYNEVTTGRVPTKVVSELRDTPIEDVLQVSRSVRAVEGGGRGEEDQDSGLAHLPQDEGCKLPMNRDRLGASNIGFNFCRRFRDETPMRTMSDEEREFHRLQIGCCMTCDAE